MAENTLVAQESVLAGVSLTLAAGNADGSKFLLRSDERTFILAENTNGSDRTITLVKQRSSVNMPGFGAVALADTAIVIPATTGKKLIGPIPYSVYADSDGYAHITFSAVTGLTLTVINAARVA